MKKETKKNKRSLSFQELLEKNAYILCSLQEDDLERIPKIPNQ